MSIRMLLFVKCFVQNDRGRYTQDQIQFCINEEFKDEFEKLMSSNLRQKILLMTN